MTIEELLKPRYKVIADWPGNVLFIGSILIKHDAIEDWLQGFTFGLFPGIRMSAAEKYPHLFKELKWWEERRPEEMPEYVKDVENDKIVYRVYGWLQHNGMFYFGEEEDCVTHTKYFIPITKEEYDHYINSKP
jgi:hypothetical protein